MSLESRSYREYWDAGYTWRDYFDNEVHANLELWRSIYERSRLPDWALEEIIHHAGKVRLLAITEDWCGDAVNTLPIVARFADAAPNVELRLVKRDENPDLMDRHLTGTSRSIPIVVVLDEDFRLLGSWGPRPSLLQEFVLGEKRSGKRSNEDIYRETRRWYVLDRGDSTLRELLAAITADESLLTAGGASAG